MKACCLLSANSLISNLFVRFLYSFPYRFHVVSVYQVRPILADIYGKDNIDLWTARWRAFFFVCSELFKMDEGRQWYVSHYLFQKPE